jgi:predicted ATP-grasp superfamily ATP-dependent carboligase
MRRHLYRRLGSLASLRKALTRACPEIVVPCDDGVVSQLHQLYAEQPQLRALITKSLGSSIYFDVVADRDHFQEVARTLNIRVPRNRRVSTGQELRDWFQNVGDTAVLKQNGTWGGNGVRIVRSVAEAEVELQRMMQPESFMTAWKRAVVDRDPIALWSKKQAKTPVVTIQEFIEGRPANTMIACWEGQVLGAVTVEVLWSQEEAGAAMVVRLIEHKEITRAALALARKLELSGMYGLDFMIDANTGAPYLIELNPRCTQLGHIPIAGQGDLSGQLLGKLSNASVVVTDRPKLPGLTTGDTIAFFPKALLWNPDNLYVSKGYLDTPEDEPALVLELLKEPWPHRQWQARLYHWLRPPRRPQPVKFEDV